jgi:hypothetical protein
LSSRILLGLSTLYGVIALHLKTESTIPQIPFNSFGKSYVSSYSTDELPISISDLTTSIPNSAAYPSSAIDPVLTVLDIKPESGILTALDVKPESGVLTALHVKPESGSILFSFLPAMIFDGGEKMRRILHLSFILLIFLFLVFFFASCMSLHVSKMDCLVLERGRKYSCLVTLLSSLAFFGLDYMFEILIYVM